MIDPNVYRMGCMIVLGSVFPQTFIYPWSIVSRFLGMLMFKKKTKKNPNCLESCALLCLMFHCLAHCVPQIYFPKAANELFTCELNKLKLIGRDLR